MTRPREQFEDKLSHFHRAPDIIAIAPYMIDWSSSISRDLVSFIIDGYDVVRGYRGINTNAGEFSADYNGPYWGKTFEARLNFPPPPITVVDAEYPSITMAAAGHFQTAEAATVLGITEAAGPFGLALRPYQWGASGNIGITHFNFADTNGGIALPDSGYHVFGGAMDATSHTFAIDGNQLSEGVAPAQIQVGTALDTMTWGANEKQSAIADHLAVGDRIHFTAVWNRKLAPLELLEFTRNPYRVLRARKSLASAIIQATVAPPAGSRLLSLISNQGGF